MMELSEETAHRIVAERYGEHLGWDWATEYGEPGYWDSTTTMVVLGNYWCRCGKHPRAGQPSRGYFKSGDTIKPDELHGYSDHHPRVWAALEAAGVQFEWYDEWMVDHETSKAYRTQPDSYSWQPSVILDDTGEWLTPDSDITDWLAWAINEPGRCLFRSQWDALIEAGFAPWPDDDTRFENGWHPGQTDDPRDITEQIRAVDPDCEIVFCTTSTGQFDVEFKALIRQKGTP